MAPNITDTENGMIIIMTITIFSLEKMKRILVKKLLEEEEKLLEGHLILLILRMVSLLL